MKDLESLAFITGDKEYLAGYRYGAANVRALAAMKSYFHGSAIYEGKHLIGIQEVHFERPTRYALGKGRIKFLVRYNASLRRIKCSEYDKGYIDAILDSVN